MKEIRAIELFAGVGGFSIGVEKASKKHKKFWSNQWEPSTKKQEASEVYVRQFRKSGHSNEDINLVKTKDIPNHDLLVGGFPSQDCSIATSVKNSQFLYGKKGVLWSKIYRILEEKGSKKPDYLFLENVDCLLSSPAKQRGRDMAVILSSLQKFDYMVECRVINAADFGMPQRRRRVFILGDKKNSAGFKQIIKLKSPIDWVLERGAIAAAFPAMIIKDNSLNALGLRPDVKSVSDNFN